MYKKQKRISIFLSLIFLIMTILLPLNQIVYADTGATITRIAGTTTKRAISGYTGDNGLATSATLKNPIGVAVDSSGNLYIADSSNNVIRKIDHATGNISTIAGTGVSGYSGDNGLATSATLRSPDGVAVDSSENVYIADSSNNVIRKIDHSTGNISTIAGTGASGYSGDNGLATSARLTDPLGVAVDSSGNIYIADCYNNVIRKIDHSTGNISTIAGTGTSGYSGDGGLATSATLKNPSGVAVGSSGNVYIADRYNNVIRKIDHSTGNISTIAGTGIGGYSGNNSLATSAKLNNPMGVAVDSSENIYVADVYNQAIRKIDYATGNISTIAGTGTGGYSGDNGLATSATLYYPIGVAVDNSGNVYIGDYNNHAIRKIDNVTGNISTIAGTARVVPLSGYSGDNGLATNATLKSPNGVAVGSSGNVYIADTNNHVIRKIDNVTGNISTIAGTGISGYSGDNSLATSATLKSPSGVAVDSSGNVYIADTGNNAVRKIDYATGNISTIAGTGISGYSGDNSLATSATLKSPSGVAVDSSGNVYIVDTGNHAIRKIDYATGNISTIAGTGTSGYSGDNSLATSATLRSPMGVAVDSSGNVYISDTDNHAIRKIDHATGNISTIAGTGTSGYTGDNSLATSATLKNPIGVVADNSGNVYISDTGNNAIRKIDHATGNISTIAGNGTIGDGGDDGLATSATLSMPSGLAMYGSANLYIADKNNYAIRKISMPISYYTVTYDGNGSTGGTVPTDSNSYTSGTSVTAKAASDLSKTDYNFTGWNTSQDGTGTPVAAGGSFSITENATLYAQWSPIVSSSLSTNTATFDKNTANQADVNVEMVLNGNTLTSITNGIYTLLDGTDYAVSGNTVTIKKSYLEGLSTGTAALAFNFSEGSPQSLEVVIEDTTPIAASGLAVTALAETPAVSGKVNLTVTPAAEDSNHKVYYKVVDSAPTALNVGDVITPSDWIEVTDANAHEITVPNGKYVEAVEVTTADNKVTKWGKSSATADGYTAPVSSSLSTNAVNFDKNTSNQADVSIGMTLNGNTLTSITNGNYTLVNGTDYTASGSLVTIKKSYLASLSTGVSPLVFNFSAGSSQSLSVIISDSTPGNAIISPMIANFDKNPLNQADVNVGMTISQNTLTSITNAGTSLVQGTDYTISGNTVSIKKSSLGKLSTGTSTVLFNSSTGSSQNLTAAISVNQTGANLTMELNGRTITSITNEGNTLVNGTDYMVNGNTVTIKKGLLTKLGTGTVNLVFNFGTENLAVTISANDTAVNVTMALNENTLTSITNGIYTLVNGIDYTVNGNTVTIKKGYLGTLSTGMSALVFNFSQGSSQSLNVTVTDTTPGTYTATFKNYDGSTIGSQTVVSGSKITEPAVPVRTGYTFGGWYKEAECKNKWDFANDTVTSAVTLYAKWTINSYTVTFKDYDGRIIGTPETVNYGGNAAAPVNPTRTGYVFAGWDKNYSNVTANLVVTATYTSGNTYDFPPSPTGNSGETEISTDYLKSKDNTLVITNPAANLSIPASAIDLTNVNGADHIKVTEKVVTPQTNTVQGLFTNLPSNVKMIGSPLNLNVQMFDARDNLIKDIHQFANNQKVKVTIKFTAAQIAGLDTSKLSMYYYDETARKWVEVGGSFNPSTKEFSFETTHFTNFAIMKKVYNSNTGTGTTGSYTVIFKDYDGSIIGVPQIVNYGQSAVAPVNPTRAGYTFTGWDKAFDSVTGDLVVTAQYSANGCTVTFEDYDGTVIGTPETVNYGGSATAPASPVRTGYVFAGWDKSFDKVTGNLVVKATYTSGNTYNFKPTATSNGEETKISAAYLTSRDNTLVVDSDGAEISIPASAIALVNGTDYIKVIEQDGEADVSKQYGSLPNGLQQVGNPLLLSIQLFDANNNYMEDIYKFANNEKIKVTMKLTADQIKGIDANVISMYYYDETAKAWLKLEGSFDSKTMEITFYMTSL